MLKNWSGGRAKRCRWRSPAVHRGAAIFMAAAFAPVAAAVVVWKSSERDVPVATDHGLAVSLVVPEVVYKTAPFEIVVVVDNLADNAVEVTVFHRDNSLEPPMLASIINGSRMSLLPVLPEGVAVQGGFIGKPFRHAYKVPARGSLSFGAEVDWRNYPDRIDRIEPGCHLLLVYFSYELGDNTSPRPLKDDPASNGPRTDLSLRERQSVRWSLDIEVRN